MVLRMVPPHGALSGFDSPAAGDGMVHSGSCPD